MRKDIRFVYFDLGRVVVDNEASFDFLAQETGADIRQIIDFFDAHWKEACLGKISSIDHLELLKKALNITTQAPDFADFWSEFHVPIKETVTLIDALSGRVKLGVLSNAEPGMFAKCIEKGKIPDPPWSSVVISSDVGSVKPERKIYEIAQKRAKTASPHIFYIDDRPENIEVARRLGWESLLFVKEDIPSSIRKLRSALGLS